MFPTVRGLLRVLLHARNLAWLAVLLLPGCSRCCGGGSTECTVDSSPVTLDLVVSRYRDANGGETGEVTLSDDRARSILSAASALLCGDDDGDGPLDVDCSLTCRLHGSVQTFDDDPSDGYLCSMDDVRRVLAYPGCIKVVKGITVNGQAAVDVWGYASGPTSGGRCVVTAASTDIADPNPPAGYTQTGVAPGLEANLWAHEIGHMQGLAHRCADYAVMRPVIDGHSERVDACEAQAYRKPRPDPTCAAGASSGGG